MVRAAVLVARESPCGRALLGGAHPHRTPARAPHCAPPTRAPPLFATTAPQVRGVSTDFLSSLSPVRHPESYIELSASKRSWARLRGAQRMGVLRRPSEGPSEASTEASDAAQDALKVD